MKLKRNKQQRWGKQLLWATMTMEVLAAIHKLALHLPCQLRFSVLRLTAPVLAKRPWLTSATAALTCTAYSELKELWDKTILAHVGRRKVGSDAIYKERRNADLGRHAAKNRIWMHEGKMVWLAHHNSKCSY